ncbi:MAG: nucleotidyltransferase domain-containing protein [Bacteroidetes bacterium]|nr:nucleotidyltransferase domain-containing protein [Bacteroidota bacterium]
MVTQQTAIEEARTFIKEVKALGVNLKQAFLFGSVARNQHTEYSDIDVALVADDFTGAGFLDIPKFVAALRTHYTIQPKTYNTSDFLSGDAFTDEIKRTGIELAV